MERLQKVIAESGVTSRRKAEELIVSGRVQVNGEVVRELGTKVSGSDLISIDQKQISKEEKEYYLLNKPRGVVSTSQDEKGRKNVVDLIDTNARIYPIGRLDYDTTGLILLTNDGDFANMMMHPKNEIEKVYLAKLQGIFLSNALRVLERGIDLDGVRVKADRIKIRKLDYNIRVSFVEITIHEGRHHQVKNMFKAVGYNVIKLKRERVGFLDLGKLRSGEYRKLNPKEVKKLYDLANHS